MKANKGFESSRRQYAKLDGAKSSTVATANVWIARTMKVAANRCMKSGKKDQAKVGYIAASKRYTVAKKQLAEVRGAGDEQVAAVDQEAKKAKKSVWSWFTSGKKQAAPAAS